MLRVPNRIAKMKPKKGLANVFHLVLTLLLPLLVYILVAMHFALAAVMLVLFSKWRMFAVKPRHWPANIRANAIDMIVGLSLVVFMMTAIQSGSQLLPMVWAAAYAIWLLFIKPGSKVLPVSAQALIGQFLGMTALFLRFGGVATGILVTATWGICYLTARHFLASFDEPQTRFFSYLWGYFGATVVWILSHYLLSRGAFFQPVLLINVIGFGIATLYYLQETDRLSSFFQRQITFIVLSIVVILVILPFILWDKTL